MEIKIKKPYKSFTVNGLCIAYGIMGCFGGAVLGFLSLGIPGLLVGLVGGGFLAIVLIKTLFWINTGPA